MLAPDDRAVLREQLRPQLGDTLDAAVATTFTLDLAAALVVPLAFAAYDIAGSNDPVAVLEAIRSATDKVDVFCQAGHMRVPPTASDLMAFLEPMVHEVEAPIRGYLFHPKIWALRYVTPDDDVRFRLLCSTRNLTGDVSWDATVRLDGTYRGGRPAATNRPLVDLIRLLPNLAVHDLPAERRERIDDLADDLARVEWENPSGVNQVLFHALGLRRTRGAGPLADALIGRRHLVVSPFLDDAGVEIALSGSRDATLVSRPEALERLDPKTLEDLDCRMLSPLAGLEHPDDGGEVPSAPSGAGSLLGGLHAKVYVVEAGRQARLFLGSANATTAGLENRNVEFIIEMVAGPKSLGIDQFLGPDAGFASLLETYEATGGAPEPMEETIGRRLENLLRSLAGIVLTASITGTPGSWTETVKSTKAVELSSDVRLTLGLLTGEGRAVSQHGPMLEAGFTDLPTADITPFIVLRAEADHEGVSVQRATVVRAELIGEPEGRLDEVIARQVDTPEKFLRFLALLLGLGSNPLNAGADETAGAGGAWSFGRFSQTGLFELLIRAVADRPTAIGDLDRLVARLEETERGRAVLPPGFDQLWSSVREAHRRLAAR